MFYLGIDLGSSSVKVALVEAETGKSLGVVKEPESEMPISATKKGWAEQAPETWWKYCCKAIHKVINTCEVSASDILSIGIAYQMHGLVLVDKNGKVLRDSIIWCDSRAVENGDRAFHKLGASYCYNHLLNEPGNFTASKLDWVKENEKELYDKAYKFLLPGDYIAYRFSNEMNTTVSGLSEGIFWDFKFDSVSKELLQTLGLSNALVPKLVDTFGEQASVSKKGAEESGLLAGTLISYRAGDQPNNALALNVLKPGEIAATCGTSGVVYAVTDSITTQGNSKINSFAHVNYKQNAKRSIGKLLCINGAGILYRWLWHNLDVASYDEMNKLAREVPIGSDGLLLFPFGNGAERMLMNKDIGTRILNLDLNRHNKAHLCRAALEGIAFAFAYGMEAMDLDNNNASTIKAGDDNLFQSKTFSETMTALTGKTIHIHRTTGAIGAAIGCTIALNGYETFTSYFKNDVVTKFDVPSNTAPYHQVYENWKKELKNIIKI